MKTDHLFHEYFQLAPEAFFELLQIEPGCPYHFESPVLKASERRLDGLLEPFEPEEPRYFVEVQGYRDEFIYWRVLQEVCLYYDQRPKLSRHNWQAVVLFLDKSYDPGPKTLGPLFQQEHPWLIRGVIPTLLEQGTIASPLLNVLRPLITANEKQVRQQIGGWVQEIQQLPGFSQTEQNRLVLLLAQFVSQKFTHMKRKEIETMLRLVPFEETVAGQEWMQEGMVIGFADQVSDKFSIPLEQVTQLLTPLTFTDLRVLGKYLLKAESYEQVEAWVDGRLATVNS